MNNLSDATSSIITIVGFKLASKPADKEISKNLNIHLIIHLDPIME